MQGSAAEQEPSPRAASHCPRHRLDDAFRGPGRNSKLWRWRWFGAVLPRDVGGHDQRCHLAGRASGRGDRLSCVAGELFSAPRCPHPCRNVARDRLDIGLQRGVVLSVVRRVIAHDVEQGHPRPARVVEVCDPVAEARPQVQEGRRRRVRHACVSIRGPSRHTLEEREDRPHFRHRIQRGDEVDLRGTGVREAGIDACIDERSDQCLGAVGHQPWQGFHASVKSGSLTAREPLEGRSGGGRTSDRGPRFRQNQKIFPRASFSRQEIEAMGVQQLCYASPSSD